MTMEIPTDALKTVEALLLKQLLDEHLELLTSYNDLRSAVREAFGQPVVDITEPEGPVVARVRAALKRDGT